MKKRYLFGLLVTILAVGLGLTACDIFGGSIGGGDVGGGGGGGGSAQESYENLEIKGKDETGRVVKTIFSTTRTFKKQIMTPQTNDSYEIIYETSQVSKGAIEISGTNVIFRPTTGGTSFEGILTTINSKPSLIFPNDIPKSGGGTITGYRTDGTNPVKPVFDTDLDTSPIKLSVGQAKTLTVSLRTSGETGTHSYQWYKAGQAADAGTPISGATSASYTLPTTFTGTSFYYVRVINASGGVNKSNVAQVVVALANTEIVVGGSGGVSLTALTDVITYMISNDASMNYTVTFAQDLAYPLFISKDTFPGTGEVTIKASVPLTRGIHITRSGVKLDGLKIKIQSVSETVPKYQDGCYCAVMISGRYKEYTAVNASLSDEPGPVQSLEEYNKAETINNVEIVNCDITFIGATTDMPMLGICADPYTVGRPALADRVKITNTEVYVNNSGSKTGRCFMGNNAVLTGNTFTSTKDVLDIEFLFPMADTITLTGNKFTTDGDSRDEDKNKGRVAIIPINASFADYSNDPRFNGDIEPQWLSQTCQNYGTIDHKFDDLPANYRTFINNLFDQIQNKTNKFILLLDQGMDSGGNYSEEGSPGSYSRVSAMKYTMDRNGDIIASQAY